MKVVATDIPGDTVLRIHFTSDDIGKVRMAARPDSLWETVFSIFRLRRPGPPLVFGPWRRAAVASIRRSDLGVLLPLVPGGYYPDFLTPAEGTEGLDAGLDAFLRTPRARLRTELDQLSQQRKRLPGWMADLAAGKPDTLRWVAGALRSHHEAVVAPVWPEVRAHIEADRAKRARALLAGGCEGLLDSFRPMMRWERPVLTIDSYRYEREIFLDGRGLLLLPAYLSWSTPDMLRDPALPPVLTYPIDHDLTVGLRASASVVALIGSTRAAVLEAIGEGRTTTELARRVGVSPASISQHTAVLREAGLIRTGRLGKSVLHTVTPLGAALLAGR